MSYGGAAMRRDMVDHIQNDWDEQRPDLDATPLGVVLRLQALTKLLGERTASRLEKYDLQWWQYDVLAALRRQGEPFTMSASELVEANMLTSGSMTHRIDRLERLGLVERTHDPTDMRRVLVRLTDAGLGVVNEAARARFDTAGKALRGLSADELATLNRLLRKVLLDVS
jgi:DNA-binding MarR family transcriptional regulator